MKIHLATDHAGFEHKEALKKHLLELGHEVIDHGALALDEEDDYPDYVLPAAYAVAKDEDAVGIVFGGSGQGEAMCANRVQGIRCTTFYGGERGILEVSRQHNNANMLAIGARYIHITPMLECVTHWLATPFSNDSRHVRRLSKF